MCDPYDFLKKNEAAKNYITVYEPRLIVFQSATRSKSGESESLGKLPAGRCPGTSLDSIKAFNGSYEEVSTLHNLWMSVFPDWPIDHERLEQLLKTDNGLHLVHAHGFCLSFLADGVDGKIACIGVLKEHRRIGLGTALINKATAGLRARMPNPTKYVKLQEGELQSLNIGSSFPRFWAGVPLSFDMEYRDWFVNRGFRRSAKPTARDLFKSIKTEIVPANIMSGVEKCSATFAPWTSEGYEECMVKQQENFGHNAAWVQAYTRLAAAGQHSSVLVAHSPTGAQIGWTIMSSPSTVFAADFAFLPLMPTGAKTGVIACVGVDKAHRGGGLGLALLVRAMEDMRRRGVEGVYIDWVVIRGFYEKLGFGVEWEFEEIVW